VDSMVMRAVNSAGYDLYSAKLRVFVRVLAEYGLCPAMMGLERKYGQNFWTSTRATIA
jgi:hypothetical protein